MQEQLPSAYLIPYLGWGMKRYAQRTLRETGVRSRKSRVNGLLSVANFPVNRMAGIMAYPELRLS
jgi:hypothetical protein